MEIEWKFDERTEAMYYLHQAKNIESGLFQNMRAVVLPYLHPNAWYLPDYNLFKNPEFILRLHTINQDYFKIEDTQFIELVRDVPDLRIDVHDITKDQKSVDQMHEAFFKLTQLFFPHVSIKKLTIIPTKIGTGSSFYLDKEDSSHFLMTYRLDKGCELVFQSILTLLIKESLTKDTQSIDLWKTELTVSDFLATKSVFSKFLKGGFEHNTLTFLDGYKGNMVAESASYFAKMGHPIASSFSYTGDSIMFNDKTIIGLSNKEIDVLKLLIDRRSQIVSFDEVGDMYWKNDPDKFSLASLAKVIEKLRNTLEQNGIPESYIRTVRKRGYLLFD